MYYAALHMLLSFTISPAKINTWEEIYNLKEYVKLFKVYPDTSSLFRDSTQLFIGYTDKALVFYAKNFQEGPYNATIRKRDDEQISGGEDAITFIISANGIGKNAYYIAINPLGTVFDKVITREGFVEWDGDITVKTQKTSYGWDCLLLVPFRSINFVRSTWGLQVTRTIISKNTILALYYTKDPRSLYEMAQLEIDFDNIKSERLFTPIIIPELRLQSTYDTASTTWKTKIKAGGVFRLKGEKNTVFDLTLLPDYSELPLDFRQFSLQRLPIAYEEKRQFFIEGRAYYQMPVSLLRTRNIENLEYGGKFYSSSENNDFALFFVKDSIFKDIFFAKYTYHLGEYTSVGFFSGLSKIDYNIASLDLSHYFQKLNTQLKIQGSRIINREINLKYFEISRNVNTGLGGSFYYVDVDSGFLSLLNAGGLLSFDDMRRINGTLQYIKTTSIKNREAVVALEFWGHNTWNKKTDTSIYKENSVAGTVYYPPFIGFVGFQMGHLDFLNLNNNSYTLYVPGIAYFISSWKQVFIKIFLGKYLGKDFIRPDITLNVSPFGMNTGIEAYFVKSILDSIGVINFYGEYRTPIPKLLLKPSIVYTDNFREHSRNLDFNIVFVYEPGYLKGIYLAYQKSIERTENNWITRSGKIIFKVRWEFKKI